MTTIGTGAIWVADADQFMIRECTFQWLKGTAIKVEESTFCQLENCQLDRCGDPGNPGKPVIDVGGGTTQGYVWARRVFSQAQFSSSLKIRAGGKWEEHAGYYENSNVAPTSSLIDAAGGPFLSHDTFFFDLDFRTCGCPRGHWKHHRRR